MNTSQLSLPFIFLFTFLLITFNEADDHIVSINCGSTGTSSAYSGRQWLGDIPSRASPLLQLKGSSTTSTATTKPTSVDQVPYKTARVSRSQFSYAFHVNSGHIIIRLHFNPSAYRGFKSLKDLFTVEAASFTLLTNFSASLLGVNSFTKEYSLNIQQNQLLDITFSAETSQSKDVYAFINGIEIISVPATLSYFRGRGIGLQVVGRNSLVNVDNSVALEIIHRLNTKHELISSPHVSDDIFGKTWKISVDVGFRYLVRLHFSKLGLKLAENGGLHFKVFINEMIADTSSDIVGKERDGRSIPWYGDYIVMMNGHKQEGSKRNLLICLQSDEEFMDGPLKGFEILKLSNHDNSLASPVPMPPSQDSASTTFQILLNLLGNRNAVGTVVVTILSILSIVVHKLREISEASSSEEVYKPSARAERVCRHFSLSEMQLATRNFSDGLVIGRGGFGKVYKGVIDNEQNTVAVKRLKSNSRQGAREFSTEIETLSELRHINLVSLIGYCSEGREMILVYEYIARGTLGDHLYNFARRGIDATPLTWKQRLNICIGAGQGLHYLHTGHRVIHRDVKASNILLDEDFEAKVADFGLAKPEHINRLNSHVSTKVKGTFGYFDPYYMATQKLSRKSDTYAFGVVLLEALCGRPALDSMSSDDERVLTIWARDKISKGEANQILDSSLRDEISPNSLDVFVRVAIKCLEDEPKNRPTMSQVVLQLELALEQQEIRRLGVSSNPIDEVARDASPSNGDNNIVSSDRADQISNEASTFVQNVTFPAPTKHTNSIYLSGKRNGRKQKPYSPSRFLAFWNRINPINRGMISETRAADIKLPSDLCRRFSLVDIKAATFKFSNDHIIGRGGSATIYKGVIDGATTVAIKRHSISSNQAADEFINEIEVMSKLRHLHLVSLIGYCGEKGEMILVYDYMARGSLHGHLHNSMIHSPLTWKQRLRICLGTANGLHYLHTGVEQTIIHRDVKSANILVNEKWEAKICDFGQLKVLGGDETFVSTMVKGTLGYLDPEYFHTNRLTDKSDVYSFGVTLFEVLCGRPAIISAVPDEQKNLATWATRCYREGTLENIIDSNVKDQITPECLSEFVGTAVACVRFNGIERPSMRDIVRSLESAIKLQEFAERNLVSDISVEESTMAKDVNLSMFDWYQIAAATNHFSSANIVGRGRFGGVYKAVLPSGEVVAVKRRPSSAEGLEELRNEMNLLPSLRHQNIIKLLGYCMDGEELVLVYEFMENTSLDYFIDKEQIQHLKWAVRFQMIMGIARGLVYLQQNSRRNVIHGDLNISSILLDHNMNPRISDFDAARSMAKFQTEGTSEIKATHGCMPPEYYMNGNISLKTDVYSFGIIVLEIISGKRMFPLYLSSSLVGGCFRRDDVDLDQALLQWNERLDLVHDSLGSAFQEDEVIRCIDVARLCIHGHPDQRPLMSRVIKMLEGNEEIMQPPVWIPRERTSVVNEEMMQPPLWPPGEVPAGISENAYVDGVDYSNATFEGDDDTLER